MLGGKVIWAQDENGELGKRPTLEPEFFEIDGSTPQRLAEMYALSGKGRRK